MLNPEAKLNPDLFDDDVAQAPTRDGYGEGLVAAGEANANVVALCADLVESTRVEAFAKKFPERFFDGRCRTKHGNGRRRARHHRC